MATEDVLAELERWYLAQCDDEWEHSFGVVINTLDNPGWRVSVDLVDTPLDNPPYDRTETHRSEDDWVVSWRDDQKWQAACGPLNLERLLRCFSRGRAPLLLSSEAGEVVAAVALWRPHAFGCRTPDPFSLVSSRRK